METLPPYFLDSLAGEISSLIKQLFNSGKPTNEILKLTGSLLVGKVSESYKGMVADFTTPDAEMLARLTRDVWQFSAAKNYQQLRDLTLALKGDDGKLREFTDYKEVAGTICAKYNQSWLRTEYNAAVASSQNAARWADFKKDAKDIPNIEYQTVGDSSVRDEHQALDGVIRPLEDPFWSIHYPPNGWGCRCEAIQSVGNKVTKVNDIPVITISPLFRTNLADTGLIYPKNHPYYNGVPRSEIRKAIAWLPPENTYTTVRGRLDIPIHINVLHNEGELHGNMNVLNDYLLKYGNNIKEVHLLPDIYKDDAKLKAKFLPAGYNLRDSKKNPDAVFTLKTGKKSVIKFKCMEGNGGRLSSHIHESYQKADYVVIKLANPEVKLTKNQIEGIVSGKMASLNGLKGVVVFDHKGSVIYEKFK